MVRSKNRKTGDVIQGIIGRNLEETNDSCRGCPLMKKDCYARKGKTFVAALSVFERACNPTLRQCLKKRPDAVAVRIGMIGDPSRLRPRDAISIWKIIKKTKKSILAYTHFWKQHPWMRKLALASCNNIEEADAALDKKWIPAAIIAHDYKEPWIITPKGRKLLVCPAQRNPHTVTCERCRLCYTSNPWWKRPTGIEGIAFKWHWKRKRGSKCRVRRVITKVRSKKGVKNGSRV
jgi:hypothetical protein